MSKAQDIMIGLYVHVPYCSNKCPYCDFYSVLSNENEKEQYTQSIIKEMKWWKKTRKFPEESFDFEFKQDERFAKAQKEFGSKNLVADTLYFGGGTPTLLTSKQLGRIVETAKEVYGLNETREITTEANPNTLTLSGLKDLKKAGINRLSIGIQSGVDCELKLLGRKHTKKQAQEAVALAKKAGFENISADIMIGIPGQTKESLKQTLDFVRKLDISHCSAYMLKIEPDTQFGKFPPKVPSEELTCELYLMAVKEFESMGLFQYEISNFAKKGMESKHNLKYWKQKQYLGFGASAHSYLCGLRFAHSADAAAYNEKMHLDIVLEDFGGDDEEWLMLALRLNQGIYFHELSKRGFNEKNIIDKAKILEKHGLVKVFDESFCLTAKGMLIQNPVVLKLLDL